VWNRLCHGSQGAFFGFQESYASEQRKRMVADFLIAAQATCQCDRLLSRDRGFYKVQFKELVQIQP
jgi:predicted nucleic acid-binding protein